MAKDVRSSDVKDLESRGSAAGTELIPAELNGRDVYLTAQQIADLGVSGGSVTSVDGRGGVVTLTDLYDAHGAAASAQAASQPIDADLTAIAALTTQTYGRSLLTATNVGALQTITGTGIYYASTYGVVADGVTDDTAAWQSVINAARAAGVGIVVAPPGLSVLSYASTTAIGRTALTLPGRVRIYGAAIGGSNLRLAAGSDCDLIQTVGGDVSQQFGGVFDIQLGGNRTNQTAGTFNHGINASGAAFSTTGDPHFRFHNVVFNGFTGHGFYGGVTAGGGHILDNCYALSCGGYGYWLNYDCQLVNSFAGFNDAAGVYHTGFSIFTAVKSYNNGRAAWWDGTAVTYSGASTYNIGNGVIGSDGVVYVANDAIAAGIANPKTTWDANGNATWIKLAQRTNFVYSSNVSTAALAVSTAVYYTVTAASGAVDTMTNSLAGTPTVASLATFVPTPLPNGPGFHFNGASAREIPVAGCDAQQNAGSGFYYQNATLGGNVAQGVVSQPNCIATTGVNRTKNPNQNAGITIDNSKGIAATLGLSRMNAGDASTGGGVQDANSAPAFYAASSPTLNHVNLVTDGSGVVPTASNIGSTNLVTYNGTQLGVPLTAAHLLVGNGSGVATDVAVSGDISITNAGAVTVSKINGVAYNGDPTVQYALLAGRSGGQTLDGDTASGGNLTLVSTAHATKGKIIFGTAATTVFDESTGRIGVNFAAPTAAVDAAIFATPASVATATGTASPHFYQTRGAHGETGGLTSIATTGTGGAGAGASFTGTPGGTALSAVTSATGGQGGTYGFVGGAGGVGGATAGSTTAIGGAGGDFNGTGGTGGAVSTANTGGAGSVVGGRGGQHLFIGGTGGAESNGTAGGTGGQGGQVSFRAGDGGTATTGSGGGTHTGGAGNNVVFTAGLGGVGTSANGAAGSILLRASTGTAAVATVLTVANPTITVADAINIAVGTTTGTIIGTATTQKLGFYNATPIVQPSSTTDLRTALINLGLYATGGASPLNLNGGALTVGTSALTDTVTITDAKNIVLGSSTGTKIGTATSQKLGFFNATPVVQQTDGATLTNNVTTGGTTNQLDDFAGTVYATDSAAIRNDIYQLGRKVKILTDALRAVGLTS